MVNRGKIGKIHRVENGEIGSIDNEFSHEWRIPDFLSLSGEEGDLYTSPRFESRNAVWYLLVCPKGLIGVPELGWIWVDFFLARVDEGPPQTLYVTLDVSGAQEEEEDKGKSKRGRLQVFSARDPACCWFQVCWRSELEEKGERLMPGNVLTVRLDMKEGVFCPATTSADDDAEEKSNENNDDVDNEISTIKSEKLLSQVKKTKKISFPARHENVIRSLKGILEQGNRADFTLKSGGRDWPVHRAILEGRSRHFATLFLGEWAERDEVRFDDVTESAMDGVLHFIYAGEVGGVSVENVGGIYAAAREFLLEDLKSTCVKYMKDKMCPEMVCGALAIAETHGERDLKERALDCFFRESDRTVVTEGWKRLKEKHPAIIGQLFEEIIKRERENRRKD